MVTGMLGKRWYEKVGGDTNSEGGLDVAGLRMFYF